MTPSSIATSLDEWHWIRACKEQKGLRQQTWLLAENPESEELRTGYTVFLMDLLRDRRWIENKLASEWKNMSNKGSILVFRWLQYTCFFLLAKDICSMIPHSLFTTSVQNLGFGMLFSTSFTSFSRGTEYLTPSATDEPYFLTWSTETSFLLWPLSIFTCGSFDIAWMLLYKKQARKRKEGESIAMCVSQYMTRPPLISTRFMRRTEET